MTTTTEFLLGLKERIDVAAALTLYAEDLDKLAAKALDLGKQSVADAWTAEARAIREELKPRIREGRVDLEKREVQNVRAALARYVKRLRKLIKALNDLYEAELAQQLEAKADRVEKGTCPMFADQTTLKLEPKERNEIAQNEAEAVQRLEEMGPAKRGRNGKGRK